MNKPPHFIKYPELLSQKRMTVLNSYNNIQYPTERCGGKKIIIANWKTHINSRKQAGTLFKSLKNKNYKNLDIIICPPFPYLNPIPYTSSSLRLSEPNGLYPKLGAQNVFYEQSGAYTGEITPKILKDLEVEYVIIGHSERRALGETDEMINKKIKASLETGLKIILCVGENLKIRQKGLKSIQKFIEKQLRQNLNGLSNVKSQLSNIIIAYEPIWAISPNVSDTPEDAVEIIKFIKNLLNSKPYNLYPKTLYGGSVNSKNIASFLKYQEIDGALIGEASTKKEEFNKMLKISDKSSHFITD